MRVLLNAGGQHGHAAADAGDPGARQSRLVAVVEFRRDLTLDEIVGVLGLCGVDIRALLVVRHRPMLQPRSGS